MVHVDLNMLTALDALLEENSVQAAADRLHLSAPAMSRTLSRIRKSTGDDILVRTGRTMTPTPRALAIRDEVRELVRRVGDMLSPTNTLDLATLRRTFTIQCHDALVGRLYIQGPHRRRPRREQAPPPVSIQYNRIDKGQLPIQTSVSGSPAGRRSCRTSAPPAPFSRSSERRRLGLADVRHEALLYSGWR